MVKISLSMAAGVLLAMLGSSWLPESSDAEYLCCGISFCACAGGMIALGKSRSIVPQLAAATFFLAGMFCYFSRSISGARFSPDMFQGILQRFSAIIDSKGFCSEKTPVLLKALLCGDRSGLDKETVAAFRSSGASHLLALSGLHLGIIYLTLRKLLWFLGNTTAGRTARSACAIVFCGFYAMMTGASPSIVRAFLFILLREILFLSPDRSAGPGGIYCSALTIQLALDPLVIRSPGFQLSYMAMAGINIVFPVMKGWFPDLPSNKGREAANRGPLVQIAFSGAMKKIWNAAALSISCQLFTAPLAWIYFESFPPYFLIANLITLPVCEALIICGLASLVLPFLIPATDFLSRALLFCTDIISGL